MNVITVALAISLFSCLFIGACTVEGSKMKDVDDFDFYPYQGKTIHHINYFSSKQDLVITFVDGDELLIHCMSAGSLKIKEK